MSSCFNVQGLICKLRFGWWFDVRILRKSDYRDKKGYKINDKKMILRLRMKWLNSIIYAEEKWPRLSFDVTFSKQCRWKGACDIKNTLDDINSPC